MFLHVVYFFSSKAFIIDCLHVCFLIPGLTIPTLLLYLTLVLKFSLLKLCILYFSVLCYFLLLKGRHNGLDKRNCGK